MDGVVTTKGFLLRVYAQCKRNDCFDDYDVRVSVPPSPVCRSLCVTYGNKTSGKCIETGGPSVANLQQAIASRDLFGGPAA